MAAILEAKSLQKIYTTRFGGNQVQALSNVSFSVEQGEYVAIMGESGSGKTTLLNILAALDKPTSGEVLLDGRSLSAVKEKEIAAFRRDNLGFVFQDFNLLDTFSLKDNIFLPLVLARRGVQEMEQRLAPLAKQLGISELMEKYPYEVSGGQKQRVSIARVFLKNPPILILDEATSSIDTETEIILQKGLNELLKGRTSFIIAHRLSTIQNCDRILYVDKGRIQESGSHEELLKQKGAYYHLFMSQYNFLKEAEEAEG